MYFRILYRRISETKFKLKYARLLLLLHRWSCIYCYYQNVYTEFQHIFILCRLEKKHSLGVCRRRMTIAFWNTLFVSNSLGHSEIQMTPKFNLISWNWNTVFWNQILKNVWKICRNNRISLWILIILWTNFHPTLKNIRICFLFRKLWNNLFLHSYQFQTEIMIKKKKYNT